MPGSLSGEIVQINVSRGGIPKRSIPQGMLTPFGVEGDSWAHPDIHGGPKQAVLLASIENIEALAAKGFAVSPGSLGENLTTRGLDFASLRIGNQLRAGQALIEITKVRVPCSTLDPLGPGIEKAIFEKRVRDGDHTSPYWGVSGFYAAVLQPGLVFPRDIIALEATFA